MPRIKPLWHAQKGICGFCKCETHLRKIGAKMKSNTATIEHIIPKSKGGVNLKVNLMMSCYKCNADRGDMDAVLWFSIRTSPIKYKAWQTVRSLSKRLTRLRRHKRRRMALIGKYGRNNCAVRAVEQKIMNLAGMMT